MRKKIEKIICKECGNPYSSNQRQCKWCRREAQQRWRIEHPQIRTYKINTNRRYDEDYQLWEYDGADGY